jgi:hypothetical protein
MYILGGGMTALFLYVYAFSSVLPHSRGALRVEHRFMPPTID